MGMMIGAVGVALCYVASSLFFWHRPHLLHKRKQVSFNAHHKSMHVTHISHRGGSAEGYENTLLTFRRAIASGTEMLEIDVRLTKDKKVVVFHDQSLERLTGINSLISETNYDQLPPLNHLAPIDTIPGQIYKDTTVTASQRRIPLLSEVFHEFKNIPINIDIKDTDTNSKELIHAVSQLIHQYGREHYTVWGSFNDAVCKMLYETNPNIGLFFSLRKVAFVMFMMVTGVLPFIGIKETHYEVFLPTATKRRRLKQVQSLPISEKLIFWICDKFLVSKPLINHLKRRGIQVYLWVANSEDEFQECLSVGANGIMTDYPKKLRAYLDSIDRTILDEEESRK